MLDIYENYCCQEVGIDGCEQTDDVGGMSVGNEQGQGQGQGQRRLDEGGEPEPGQGHERVSKDGHVHAIDGERHTAVARFLTVYIEEAHASDEWYLPHAPNAQPGGSAYIPQHRTLHDRISSGQRFLADFSLPTGFHMVYDTMTGDACDRYDAWPERLYVVMDGVVVYKGGLGPADYNLAEVKDWLAERYGMRGVSMPMHEVKMTNHPTDSKNATRGTI